MTDELTTLLEPIHIISLGAGVQSSTMALMAARGEIMPMPKCAIFADTGDEPKEVYEWLDELTQMLPFHVYKISNGKLSDHILNKWDFHKYQRGSETRKEKRLSEEGNARNTSK